MPTQERFRIFGVHHSILPGDDPNLAVAFRVAYANGKAQSKKASLSLDERLLEFAEDCRAKAQLISCSEEQAKLLEKARQLEGQIAVNRLIQTDSNHRG